MQASPPETPPQTACPKCGQRLETAPPTEHCRACGLATAHMASFAATRAPDDHEVLAAWQALTQAWQQAPRHAEFIELARQRAALPLAARCYRQHQASQPQDQIAADQLRRVTKLVQVEMAATVAARVAPVRQPYQKVVVLLTVLVAMSLAAWVYFALIAKKAPARPAPAAVTPAPPAKPFPNAEERRRLRQQQKGPPPPTRQRVPWTPDGAR